MKRRVCLFLACSILFPCVASARINMFEPWHPGQDSAVGNVYSYQPRLAFIWGNQMFEVPFSFTYVSSPRLEVGGRWGVRSVSGNTGLNDLLLGLKYQFLEEADQNPGVIGEAGIALPTADSTKGLGTGGVSLLLNWGLQKQIEKFAGYFGLGVRLNSENSSGLQQGNVFSYHAGVGYPYRDRWRLYGELKGFNHSVTKLKGTDTGDVYQELYLAPGADYAYDARITLSASLLIGLTPESHKIGFLISGNF